MHLEINLPEIYNIVRTFGHSPATLLTSFFAYFAFFTNKWNSRYIAFNFVTSTITISNGTVVVGENYCTPSLPVSIVLFCLIRGFLGFLLFMHKFVVYQSVVVFTQNWINK